MRVELKNFSHAKKKKGVWQLDTEGALDLDALNVKVLSKTQQLPLPLWLAQSHVAVASA